MPTRTSVGSFTATLSACLLLQIHDELVLEAPESELSAVTELVRHHMEGAAELAVPLGVDVGVGADWATATG